MKIIKGLAVFFILVGLTSCFDQPRFPDVPEIRFNKVEFVDDPASAFDSLIVYIDFKDGDGDLGIDAQSPEFISYPFHNSNFFLGNNGQLEPLYTTSASSSTDQYDILNIPDPSKGKLLSFRSRLDPLYNGMLSQVFHCSKYEALAGRPEQGKPVSGRKLLIEKDDIAVLDDTRRIVDTLRSESTEYYQIADTLYFQLNPNHFNIEIDFLVRDSGSNPPTYTEFDWFEQTCQPFDGRFPFLTDKDNSLEGTLSYAMISTGFNLSFSIKPIKLRITIKDRLLHVSNVVESNEFTLDAIRVSRSSR